MDAMPGEQGVEQGRLGAAAHGDGAELFGIEEEPVEHRTGLPGHGDDLQDMRDAARFGVIEEGADRCAITRCDGARDERSIARFLRRIGEHLAQCAGAPGGVKRRPGNDVGNERGKVDAIDLAIYRRNILRCAQHRRRRNAGSSHRAEPPADAASAPMAWSAPRHRLQNLSAAGSAPIRGYRREAPRRAICATCFPKPDWRSRLRRCPAVRSGSSASTALRRRDRHRAHRPSASRTPRRATSGLRN